MDRPPNVAEDDEEEEEEDEGSVAASIAERFAGFSIREYALGMRGAPRAPRSWALPREPMACPRYRWWAAELEAARSAGGRRPPPRKKKRSIVELFAVAPQVDAAGTEEEDGDEDEEDVSSGEKEELLRTLLRRRRRRDLIEKRKHQYRKQILRRKAKKGKIQDAVVPSETGLFQLLHGTVLKRYREEIKDPIGKKKPRKTQGSSRRRRAKVIQSSSLLFKGKFRKSSMLPIQGILKIPMKASPPNKFGKSVRSHNSDHMKVGKSRKSKRHVSFSDKNDIIGQKKKIGSPWRFSDVLDMSAAEDKSVTEMPAANNGTKNDAIELPVGVTEGSSLDAREFSGDDHDNPIVFRNSMAAMNCGMDLNHSPHACDSSFFSDQHGPITSASNGCNSSMNILGAVPRNDNQSVMEYLVGGQFPTKISASRMMRPNNSPPVMNVSWYKSHAGSNSLEPCIPQRRAGDGNSYHSIQHGRNVFDIVSPTEASCQHLTARTCSSMSNLQLCPTNLQIKDPVFRLDPSSVCRDRFNDDGFIGLPLNSQGEFIQWHSGDEQLKQSQNSFICSQRNYMQNSIDYWSSIDRLVNKGKFPDTSAHRKEKETHIPNSQFLHVNCMERYQDRPNTSNRHVNFLDQGLYYSTSRKMNGMEGHNGVQVIPVGGHSQNGFQPVNQPTVRLMGKDVAVSVGDSNFHGFLRGKGWLDKETTIRTRPDQSTQNWFAQHKWPNDRGPVSIGNKVAYSVESGRSPQGLYEMIPVDPPLQSAHMESGSQWPAKNAISFNKCYASNFGNFLEHPTTILPNGVMIESPKLLAPSVPYNSCFHIPPNSRECQCSRNPFSNERSYRSNFLDRGSEYQDRLLCSNRTSHFIPPWLTNMEPHKKFQDASSSYSTSLSKCQPLGVSVADIYPFTHPLHQVDFPCSNNSAAYVFGPSTATINPPIVDPTSISLQTSAVPANHQDTWKTDPGMRPGFSYLRGLDQSMRSKRRVPLQSDDLTRPAKITNSMMFSGTEFQDNVRDGHFANTYMQCSPSQLNFHGYGNNADPCAPGSDSPRVDGESRIGPVKLSAGAKHIIRPGQNGDPDNSLPVHSTIPFTVGSSSGNILEPHSKSAKIYQF